VLRAIDDAENAGAISAPLATGLRAFAARLPVDELLNLFQDAGQYLGDAGAARGLLP
jgi:hypothetical protein